VGYLYIKIDPVVENKFSATLCCNPLLPESAQSVPKNAGLSAPTKPICRCFCSARPSFRAGSLSARAIQKFKMIHCIIFAALVPVGGALGLPSLNSTLVSCPSFNEIRLMMD
jgi:hypothetical protein